MNKHVENLNMNNSDHCNHLPGLQWYKVMLLKCAKGSFHQRFTWLCLSLLFSIEFLNPKLRCPVSSLEMIMGSVWKPVIQKYLLLRISLIQKSEEMNFLAFLSSNWKTNKTKDEILYFIMYNLSKFWNEL